MMTLDFRHNGVTIVGLLSLLVLQQIAKENKVTDAAWLCIYVNAGIEWIRRYFRGDHVLWVDIYYAYKVFYAAYMASTFESTAIIAITSGLDALASYDEVVGYRASPMACFCCVLACALCAEFINYQATASVPVLGVVAVLLHPWVTASINGDLQKHRYLAHGGALRDKTHKM